MKVIVDDLFLSIYRYLGFGFIFAFISLIEMQVLLKDGLVKTVRNTLLSMKNKIIMYRFIFLVYLFMMLARTLICRSIWEVPWQNIVGEWFLYTSDGNLNSEGILNLLLFAPLLLFGYLGFCDYLQLKGEKRLF